MRGAIPYKYRHTNLTEWKLGKPMTSVLANCISLHMVPPKL